MRFEAVRSGYGRLFFTVLLIAQGGLAQAGADHSLAAHVHGTAEMEIVQDGNGLYISLVSPLHNVLGFEHSPKTDEEKVRAKRAVALLKSNGLFSVSADAQCQRTGHKLFSEVLNPHSHGPDDDHHHHDTPHGAHADFRASYEFECARPDRIKSIEFRGFRQFPALERIDVQALFPTGQVGASLTPGNNALKVK